MNPKHQRPEKGAVAFETIVVLMLVIFPLIFGIMDFSRAMYAYHFVAYAAREGSRWASVRGASCVSPMVSCGATSTQIQTFVQSFDPPGMYVTACNGTVSGSLCATATWSGKEADGITDCTNGGTFSTNFPGCVVQVKVNYYYGFTLPFLSKFGTLNMTSTSQMTISQ